MRWSGLLIDRVAVYACVVVALALACAEPKVPAPDEAQAARVALDDGRLDDARLHAERALERAHTPEVRADLLLVLGEARARLGHADADAPLQAVLDAPDSTAEQRAEAYRQRARARLGRGDTAEALAELARGRAVLPSGSPRALDLDLTEAAVLWQQGEAPRAEALWLRTRAAAEAAGRAELALRALEGLVVAWQTRGLSRAAGEACDRALSTAETVRAAAPDRARLAANCASVRRAQGQPAAARALALAAVGFADTAGAARARVHARLAVARALEPGSREALESAQAAVELARAQGVDTLLDDALVAEATAAWAQSPGDDTAARALAALEPLERDGGVDALTRSAAETLRLHRARRRNDPAAAAAHALEAIAQLEAARARTPADNLSAFYDDERDATMAAAVGAVAQTEPVRAHEVATRWKSRALVGALLARRATLPVDLDRAPDASHPEVPRALQPEAPFRFSLDTLRAALPPGARVLDYVVLEDETLVFELRPAGPLRMHRVPLDRSAVRARVQALTAELAKQPEPSPGTLNALRPLLPPDTEPSPAGVDVIVPHGPLEGLPFELLTERPTTYAPNAALLTGPPAGAPRARPLLLIADPSGDLPAAEGEGRALEAMFPGALRLGPDAATPQAVRAALGAAGRVHFAGHADPAVDGRPAALRLAGGARLDAAEVGALTLDLDLVVLAACATAAPPDQPDEPLGVLDHAFLHAGARRVVTTRWPIDDAVTAAFMRVFWARVDAVGPARAAHEARAALARAPAPGASGTARGLGREPATKLPTNAARHRVAFMVLGAPR